MCLEWLYISISMLILYLWVIQKIQFDVFFVSLFPINTQPYLPESSGPPSPFFGDLGEKNSWRQGSWISGASGSWLLLPISCLERMALDSLLGETNKLQGGVKRSPSNCLFWYMGNWGWKTLLVGVIASYKWIRGPPCPSKGMGFSFPY